MSEGNNKKKEALFEAAKAGTLEIAKIVAPIAPLITGIQKYHEYIETEQKEEFLQKLEERISGLEDDTKEELRKRYQRLEEKEFVKKTVASALNAEYADKIEFFANAIANSTQDIQQLEKLKFIDMVRQLSKAAIRVLAEVIKIHNSMVGLHQVEQIIGTVISQTEFDDRDHVRACISELVAVGLLHANGKHITATDFTSRFVNFIKDPRIVSSETKR